ncbi:hypothetical protein ABIE26_002271 [Pedobacter africanus]|uniref:Uncharacterized protein n=1 Tax=Pedobacter africanus TaxID=151894 RepID=A0ACC6KYS5_9SPHI|nr:hypothetical protein [Pedobacter africanus]MDR6784340.1 hypothetical protein [Pedobacter africanus]
MSTETLTAKPVSKKADAMQLPAAFHHNKPWTAAQKILFRIVFIFVTLFSFPLDAGFYQMIWHFDYAHLNYRDLTEVVAFFNPQFINIFSASGFFGTASYINFPFILFIAVIGALIWTALDKKSREYKVLYYWVRVFARYRVAYAGIGWGYKKLFVMQMPREYEGLWNTEMIDFFAKRLYWEALSVVPRYEVFLGFAEFIGGFLLLFRRTTSIGAAITLVVFGNIAISNHAYDIGEQVPSAAMAMLSLFVLWHDVPGIWSLIVKERDTQVLHDYPEFTKGWQKYTRLTVKYAFNFVFVLLFFIFEVYGYTHNDFYKIPNTPGLKGTAGQYEVTTFKLNNKVLPYSPLDSIRWQDVTFEDWSSISIKLANRPQDIEMFAAGSYPRRTEVYNGKWHFHWQGDIRRYGDPKKHKKKDPAKRDLNITWESSGMSGRHWYYYKADTVNHILYLQNKSKTSRHLKQVLHYSRPSENRIILSGTNEFKDSIYVILDRSNKNYPLLTGNNSYKTN